MPALDDLPGCPKCRDLPEETLADPDTVLRIPTLHTPDEVRAYPVVDTDCTHFVDLPSVRASYSLAEKIPCKFPDHTPHQTGYVGQARCGVIVNVGHICGAKWIQNFDVIKKELKKHSSAVAAQAALKNAPELLRVCAEIAAQVEQIEEFRGDLRQDLPAVWQAMQGRMSQVGGRRTEVMVETTRTNTNTGERQKDYDRRELRGIDIFDDRLSATAVAGLQTRLRALIHEMGDVDSLKMSAVNRHIGEYGRIKGQLDDYQSKVDNARQFFAEDNLRLVLYAAGADADVSAAGFLYTHTNGRRFHLSLEGRRNA